MKKIIIIAALLLLAVSCGRKEEVPQTVQPFPQVTSADFMKYLSSQKGRVVIVNFFATWCPPCRMEIPELIDLNKTYGQKNLSIVGLSVDEAGNSVLVPFAAKMNFNYSVYLAHQDLVQAFQVGPIPATFVFDKEGRLARAFTGFVEKKLLTETIEPLL